jgi:cytochrome c553
MAKGIQFGSAILASLTAVAWPAWAWLPAQEPVDFLREVKPILAEKCLVCHGPDEPEADLRLDTADGAFGDLGGYAAVVPGEREESELWYRITTDDGEDRMPPADHGEPLSATEQDVLGRWIDEGAPWQEHWGFAAWREVEPPAVHDQAWLRDPIDQFVLARLEQAGLTPAEDADELAWLRRVYFDLIGLPPTRAEIDTFLALPSEQRRATTVDRLLASPHFGEKWARHMLDLVRYAETRGHEFDYPIPNAWEYRDYLVRALNLDIGWDQLMREHVAGDLLPEPRTNPQTAANESVIGTGFWWLGEAAHSPVDLEVDLADRTANQIDVFGKSFLGLTIACARCHDHKFDPIPTRDYYSLAGFVQSASYRQVRYESLEHNARIREQLQELDLAMQDAGEVGAAARARWSTALQAIPALAQEGAALAAQIDRARNRQVLADFEAGIPAGWLATGSAFEQGIWRESSRPERYPHPKAAGDGFLNSQLLAAPDGTQADAATGSLRSTPFMIEHDFLSFRVGGGKLAGEVGVRLLVEDRIVAEACGESHAEMRSTAWDLRRWRGKEAVLEVYDQATGGWGHVSCDDFVFQNAVPELELAQAHPSLDAKALLAWAQDPIALDAEQLAWLTDPQFPAEAALDLPSDRELIWGPGAPWWQDGASWRTHPSGPIVSAFKQSLVGWSPWPALVSDPDWELLEADPLSSHEATQVNWKGSGRTLRTSTVVLGEGPVWYLLHGSGVAFAPVEHHRILNGPLHTPTALRFNTHGRWQWVRHDYLTRYPGLRVHFEFSPTEDWIGLAAVVQGGESPPSTLPASNALDWFFERPGLVPPLDEAGGAERAFYEARRTLLNQRVLRSRMAPALLDGNGVDQELLFRGNTATPRDRVPRSMLAQFRGEAAAIAAAGPDGRPTSGRLQLVEQMIERAGALLARVYVNRIWQHLMGRGIVPQPDNFGVLAGYPTHPDLLDALAGEARDSGWRLKPLVRRIVLSRSYGLASSARPGADQADPQNLLWHHRPPRRLSAEAVRDALLCVSGSLDASLGGPSIPVYLTPFMNGRGKPGRSGPLDGAGRRTLYQEIRRNFLPPFLMVWDYPPPATTMGRRSSSNVPAQSLALMNDPLVRELAQRWAVRLDQANDAGIVPSTDSLVQELWWSALTRAPRAMEAEQAIGFLQKAEQSGQARVDALAELCHVIFNLKEFVYLP